MYYIKITMLKITFIGAGNVATHLALAFSKNKNILIEKIYSQNIENAMSLVQKIKQGEATNSLDFEKSEANIFIIAIKDDAFEDIFKKLKVKKETIILHTSGSHSLQILEGISENIGVFYPLQTFSKDKEIDFSSINICLEANNIKVLKIITDLNNELSANAVFLDSAQRKVLHISAVFSCNFVNHLWALSEKYLENHSIAFDLLAPLLKETLQKALSISPQKSQTGPAQRNDTKMIEKHLDLLNENQNMKNIYQILTESIIKNR